MFQFKNKKEIGFTLVEMLISISLFTIVTTIAFSALYSILDANIKSQTIKLVVNNLNVAMESMSRDIRVGYNYCGDPGSDCDTNSSGSDKIIFTNKDGCEVTYKFDLSNNTIKKSVSGSSCSAVNGLAIVGDDVKINNLKFYIGGTDPGPVDTNQPRVIIILQGETNRSDIDTKFDIQTTITQRNLDA